MRFRDYRGTIINEFNDDNEYMNAIMHFMNSLARKTSTYKYAFFKSILDNLFNANENYEISFDDLSYSFSKMYWNLISKYKLPQYQNGGQSLIEKSIYNILKDNSLWDGIDFDSLNERIQYKFLESTKSVISINVVGALYSDLTEVIYGFDKSKKIIWFNEKSYNFLVNYKSALKKLNYYAWILWIENNLSIKEQEVGNIASKLDQSTKRESLERFKNKLKLKGDELKCFYCNKEITIDKCHLDHFVPWSFVKDDKLWNLVFSCSKCNESKNNKLPSFEFVTKIIERNKVLFKYDYKREVTKLYDACKHNGFITWERRI